MPKTLHNHLVKLKTELFKELKFEQGDGDSWELLDRYLKYAITVGYEKAMLDLGANITEYDIHFE